MRAIRAISAVLMLTALAWGQSDQGVITGTISDSTGAVIPGARVTVREMNTNVSSDWQSNASGTYVAGPLRIGVYEITVETEGFKKSVRAGVEIQLR